MDRILIAEDDVKLQSFLRISWKKYDDKFQALFARNGEEAIKILNQKHISLVVTDIVMPKVDGIALMNYINDNYPHIPCIVMTAHQITGLETKLTKDNLLCVFQKPFMFEEMTQAITQALEQEIPSGALKGISVASFFQMLQLEAKTCLVEVQSAGQRKGMVYFQDGIACDAVIGKLKGEDAAYEIIVMENAEIRFLNLPSKKIVRRITTDLTGLIMEAMRRKDEPSG